MKLICTQCGTVGKPTSRTSGSIFIELALWCCFIVPGFIYSLWRLTTRKSVCRCCGASALVPVDSPTGARLVQRNVNGVGL